VEVTEGAAAPAVRFIHEHARAPIGVPAIVAAAHVSRRVLERGFRAHLGRTIRAALLRVRIGIARELLVDTLLPVARVAEKSGFPHVQHFNVVFKRHAGMTPTACRRKRQVAGGSAAAPSRGTCSPQALRSGGEGRARSLHLTV
jgi:transcriptional regulator GlxA family with amidase domain